MPLARRIIALLLLALWVPSVAHCRLEAIGAILVDTCCANSADTTDHGGCAADGCDTVEGEFANSTVASKAPAPVWCACVACLSDDTFELPLSPPTVGVIEAATAPPEIIRSRHFLARAALPPRAPDCVS